ncbi:MAG TPA: hypothetical protein VGM21_08175 [Actinomycetota bacterium]|jgi:hypothetical protein
MRLLSRERTAAVGSALLAIDRRRARGYERVLAPAGRPPTGWNPAGEHGAPVGWDLVLVAPRTLSVLLYQLTGQALAQLERGRSGVAHANALFGHHQQLAGAHHQAVELTVRQFTEQAHLASPWQGCHPLDSAHQALLHTHTIFGALTPGGRRLPHDPQRLRAHAQRAIRAYHRRLRERAGGVAGCYGWWGPPGADGSTELLGLPAELLAAHGGACRPLSEIGACARAVGDL